ncbi:MAG: response regulator [Thermodesulfobacteriota bacterium]
MKQILIVDDETNFLLSLQDGLQGSDDRFAISTAGNGKEAMAVLAKGEIDLVITDIKMPDMDGLELLAKMSVNHPDVPVIVMTAFGSSAIEEKLENMGAFRYIEKPIDFDTLIDRVNEGLAAAEKGRISGVSLSSFMQLLNLDKKTCTLRVSCGDMLGTLFFLDGELMNAFTDTLTSQEAALEIATWEPVEIEIQNFCRQPEKVIDAPLGYILIESARMKDERSEKAKGTNVDGEQVSSAPEPEPEEEAAAPEEKGAQDAASIEKQVAGLDFEFTPGGSADSPPPATTEPVSPPPVTQPVSPSSAVPAGAQEVDPATLQAEPETVIPPAVEPLLAAIGSMDGVVRAVVQTTQGIMLAEVASGGILKPFLHFVLAEAANLNRDLGFSSPRTLILNRDTGDKLLIVTGPAVIVGLEISNETDALTISDSLRPMVRRIVL